MTEPIGPLTVELLGWLSSRPRTYAETMEAWGSNCPRHPVWEEAVIDGFVEVVRRDATVEARVTLTGRGRAMLDEAGANAPKQQLRS